MHSFRLFRSFTDARHLSNHAQAIQRGGIDIAFYAPSSARTPCARTPMRRTTMRSLPASSSNLDFARLSGSGGTPRSQCTNVQQKRRENPAFFDRSIAI
jgi:hypothetical protein